ncbi:vWA domain-containing protein [Pseudonocardia sp. CA-107938]|uniref:vWA domain-containing protein n=1 Tax=Pseudonocardia sp. CA-107938 TaxID=3240021 RepID=UPI003D950973
MSYQRRIDRLSPALIIILVDQSESMSEAIGGGTTSKAQAVADQLNTLVYELVLRCVKSAREAPRPYFFVSVIGYSTTQHGDPIVEPAFGGALSTTDLAAKPLRVENRAGAAGGMVNSPVWVEPIARGGTPMCGAFDQAGRLAAEWVGRHPDAFPPVIVNLTDGEATDGDPAVWASRLRSLATSDGQVLLFNLSLSADTTAGGIFPSTTDGLGPYAAKLFHMSSPLPPPMLDMARAQGIAVRPGAHGFAYNADIKALAAFMNVGTSIGRVAR